MGERINPKRLSALRILMNIRPNALTQRGGDTVVMERFAEGLRAAGHVVDIDPGSLKKPAEYDLVHLYNFATPEITEALARRTVNSGTPYVVTTLYEDWPLFVHQMAEYFYLIEHYLDLQQPQDRWEELVRTRRTFPEMDPQDNSFSACYAEALMPSGANEKSALMRDYPNSKRFEICHFGCEVNSAPADPQLFIDKFQVRDFVLCVGRLETRKNQLMLLKALENVDVPVVFAAGGFTYQEKYTGFCKRFRRAGQTLFLEKLSPELLSSAYAAARVHALPSFFELPGLVNIEAASAGTNVVVTDYGTIRDYLGDDAFYCSPTDDASIRKAVLSAYDAPRNPALQARAKQFTWAKSSTRLIEIYENVLANFGYTKDAPAAKPHPGIATALTDAASNVTATGATVSLIPAKLTPFQPITGEVDRICAEADELARAGKTDLALAKYNAALQIDRAHARAYRSLGAVSLSVNKVDDADRYFQKALILNPNDLKAKTGAAAILWQRGQKERAFQSFRDVLEKHPRESSTLLYFMNACYELNRMPELEQALVAFLKLDPENVDFNFCLAGCYYRQKKYQAARDALAEVFRVQAMHQHGLELKSLIERDEEREAQNAAPAASLKPESSSSQDFDAAIARVEELLRTKKYDEALVTTKSLLSDSRFDDDQQALISVLRGEALAIKGNLSEAEVLFRAAEKSPTYNYRAIAGRGIVAGACNNWDEAAKFFERSLQLNPTHDVALAGLGIHYMLQGNNHRAWESYQHALHVNPENIRALLGLVQLAYALGRLPELEEALGRFLEYCPANLSILYSYAGCLYAQGKSDRACEQIAKIFIFEPEHELAKELLRKIESDEPSRSRASA